MKTEYRVILYTKYGQYKGWRNLSSRTYLEIRSWILSGNEAYYRQIRLNKNGFYAQLRS